MPFEMSYRVQTVYEVVLLIRNLIMPNCREIPDMTRKGLSKMNNRNFDLHVICGDRM